jgi:hypothetical protein
VKELSRSIAKVIKDYRNDGEIFIDSKHVLKWVSQFKVKDQEFVLTELLHILPESYFSKGDATETFTTVLNQLSEEFSFPKTKDFLSHAVFLNRQEGHKSQCEILNFVDEHLKSEYSLTLKRCGKREIRYWLYFDDVLASGATFRRDIKSAIEEYGVDNFKNDGIRIVAVFLFVHDWGEANTKFILQKDYDRTVSNRVTYYRVRTIDNNPRINYYNPNPKFNHAYPVEIAKYEDEWLEYLASLDADKHVNFAFRNPKYPLKESFYSSAKSRIRFETILLNSGLKILAKADNLSPPIRPLGLVSPGYQTFGTGSHAFTWRNISNTCPIVYWWENHGWYPLFSVQNRGKK